MGSDFISGYIGLAEGEKDPRNLLLAFAIARVLLIEFDTAKHIEVSKIVCTAIDLNISCRIYSTLPSAISLSLSAHLQMIPMVLPRKISRKR